MSAASLPPAPPKALPPEWVNTLCDASHVLQAQRVAYLYRLTTSDIRGHNNLALRRACEMGRLDIARWMVRQFGLTGTDARAASLEGVPNYALRAAHENGHVHVVKWLVWRFNFSTEDLHCIFTDGRPKIILWQAEQLNLPASDVIDLVIWDQQHSTLLGQALQHGAP